MIKRTIPQKRHKTVYFSFKENYLLCNSGIFCVGRSYSFCIFLAVLAFRTLWWVFIGKFKSLFSLWTRLIFCAVKCWRIVGYCGLMCFVLVADLRSAFSVLKRSPRPLPYITILYCFYCLPLLSAIYSRHNYINNSTLPTETRMIYFHLFYFGNCDFML